MFGVGIVVQFLPDGQRQRDRGVGSNVVFTGASLAGARSRELAQKAVEGVQRVAHMALVRVQTRNDDEA